jgi:hypothetical protein
MFQMTEFAQAMRKGLGEKKGYRGEIAGMLASNRMV